MKIVNAKIEDFEKVYDLICELESEVINKENLYQIYSRNISNSDIYYFLALDGSEIIGFASVHIQYLLHHAAKIAELQELIVTKGKQGIGVGSLLFNQIKKIAFEANCNQLEVCCNQIRKDSHKFYEKNGMKNSHFKFTLPFNNIIK